MFASSSCLCVVVAALAHSSNAFAPSALQNTVHRPVSSSSSAVFLSSNDEVLGRRDAFAQAAQLVAGVALTSAATTVPLAFAEDGEVAVAAASSKAKKVLVAGATGQTGRRILERLADAGNLEVVGGVRNVDKATASLGESSTVVRGAMIQKVASVDTSAVALKRLDVVKDSVDDLAATMAGAESLVIATGFIPGNPLKMNAAAHDVVRSISLFFVKCSLVSITNKCCENFLVNVPFSLYSPTHPRPSLFNTSESSFDLLIG